MLPTEPLTARLPGGALVVMALVGMAATPSSAAAQHADPHAIRAEPAAVEEGVDYRVYDRWGNRTSLLALVGSSMNEDVLLVGEEHGNPVGHAVEAELLEAVFAEIGAPATTGRPVVLSLEMFERDVQYILDEYLDGLISEDHFLRSVRPWEDYGSRYRPLVEAAKAAGVPVIAANAPRRYVSRVTDEGPESLAALSPEARRFLPPLPYPGPSPPYRREWDAIMEQAGGESRGYVANPNAIHAQALWDASMGHAIAQALIRHPDAFLVHLSGSFHVARGTGIPERIEDYRPGTEVTSVVLRAVDDIDTWTEEHGELGDFVVLTRRRDATRPDSITGS